MSEFTQPKIIPIENRPPKSKVFVKCIVAPIVIFLLWPKSFPLAGLALYSLASGCCGL